jgi:hypothetical protein
MPVLGDFEIVFGGNEGQVPKTTGDAVFAFSGFGTGGRRSASSALLVYSVRDMTGTAHVLINGIHVGTITPSGASGVYSTQMIPLSGNQLKDGQNTMALKSVTDAFWIKNVVCFFHQST